MEQGTGNQEHGFRRLKAWRKSDELLSEVFDLTERKLATRHRWLGSQMIRAAYSVTPKIAEGYGRSSLPDYLRFLELAGASLNEMENGLHFMKKKALRTKLKDRGTWQLGLIAEEPAKYGEDWESHMFQVPGSQFQDEGG